ncbi:hypothetical protein ACSSS7_001785 [Eimeria intestinalis]
MRAFGPHANRATTRRWATPPLAVASRGSPVGGEHAFSPLTTTAGSNDRSTSRSNNSSSSERIRCVHPLRLFLVSNPATITRAPLDGCRAPPPVLQHSRGATTVAEWGHLSWARPAEGAPWRRHEGVPLPVRILATMPTVELCWRLCEEERGQELSANLTSRILDALRGPQGPGEKLFYKGSPSDCPAHERGWLELRGELHEALELLFEEARPLPRSLSELRIGAAGEFAVSGEEEAAGDQWAALWRRRRPRSPELIFEVLSPQAFAFAAPKQQRKAAQQAFLSVVEEHFALKPRSAEVVDLDKLLLIVGPVTFLDLLPLLLQQQQRLEDQQQPHGGGQQQQEQQAQQQQQRRQLQHLRRRLSPASLGALLRRLCEAQGPLLFEAPMIFAACWAAEDPQRVEQLSGAEGLKALVSPLKGTGVSWRFLLDVAQRRQSEPFLLHLFACMDSHELKKAAAAALAEKHPLSGQLLDPWGFMVSRSLNLQPDSGVCKTTFVTACDAPHRNFAHQCSQDEWSSRTHADVTAQASPCGAQAKVLSAGAHTITVSSNSGRSNNDSTRRDSSSNTSSADITRNGFSLPEDSIRFVGSASEIGECFEFLRRRQQRQTRLMMTQTELQELLSQVGLPGDANIRALAYGLARNKRLSLRSLQADAADASGNQSLQTENFTEESLGAPSLSLYFPKEEWGPSSWGPRGAPHGEFLFPLEMGEECGCAALLPLAVGLRVIGATPFPASLLCLSVSSGVLVIDLLNRQQAYAAAVCRLLQWLLPNPLIVKVLFDSGDILQRLALGPLSSQEGPPLGPLVHAIDLRQPRIYRVVGAPGNQPGALLRDAQLAEALTRGDEALLRDVLRRKQGRQQQHEQQPQQQRGFEMETQVLTIGTRRTLSDLGHVVLGAEAPAVSGRLTRSGNPNRRPLDLQGLRDAANEAFSLLLIERKLRQTMLMPKSILGGSGVHSLLFDKTAVPNAWLLDRSKCAAHARRRLREAMEAQDTFTR